MRTKDFQIRWFNSIAEIIYELVGEETFFEEFAIDKTTITTWDIEQIETLIENCAGTIKDDNGNDLIIRALSAQEKFYTGVEYMFNPNDEAHFYQVIISKVDNVMLSNPTNIKISDMFFRARNGDHITIWIEDDYNGIIYFDYCPGNSVKFSVGRFKTIKDAELRRDAMLEIEGWTKI